MESEVVLTDLSQRDPAGWPARAEPPKNGSTKSKRRRRHVALFRHFEDKVNQLGLDEERRPLRFDPS